jgi:hypothetical protein
MRAATVALFAAAAIAVPAHAATHYAPTPRKVAKLAEALAHDTKLPRRGAVYPNDRATLAKAAAVFARSVRQTYGVVLSVPSDDERQLDRFFDQRIVDERVSGARRIPNEPLFYYCAGAFWGEWLVRHRNAEWRLRRPVRPMRYAVDAVHAGGATCMLPFAHVLKKAGNPQGERLDVKAGNAKPGRQARRILLVASADDVTGGR